MGAVTGGLTVRDPRHVLITGASSGIGAALARAYAGPDRTLHLCGRDRRRLGAVAAVCRKAGAEVTHRSIDVRDRDGMALWVSQADEHAPLDLIIANAGIAYGVCERPDDLEPTRRMIDVNLVGALNTIEPAITPMMRRRRGQICLVGSLAALRGIAGSHGYSASKAALKALGEGLRPALRGSGVSLNVVLAGFVRTPMNEGADFPMPMRLEAERAAAVIKAALARDKAMIAFPRTLFWSARLMALWPSAADALAMRVMRSVSRP